MTRRQGKFAKYMWEHAGISIRPKGIGGKMHLEARGKTAIIVLISWFALVALIIEEIL